ncbi:hypothetical protein ADL03_06440 [Nocardia sp. NRRL S-836]|nr:hypothetical protein ADL03_06440 [Nocardia sp. NRRL S-836]
MGEECGFPEGIVIMTTFALLAATMWARMTSTGSSAHQQAADTRHSWASTSSKVGRSSTAVCRSLLP